MTDNNSHQATITQMILKMPVITGSEICGNLLKWAIRDLVELAELVKIASAFFKAQQEDKDQDKGKDQDEDDDEFTTNIGTLELAMNLKNLGYAHNHL